MTGEPHDGQRRRMIVRVGGLVTADRLSQTRASTIDALGSSHGKVAHAAEIVRMRSCVVSMTDCESSCVGPIFPDIRASTTLRLMGARHRPRAALYPRTSRTFRTSRTSRTSSGFTEASPSVRLAAAGGCSTSGPQRPWSPWRRHIRRRRRGWRDTQGDGGKRLGSPEGVRRHQRHLEAHVRPQRRLHGKRLVEGGDQERPDVALEAGAGPCRPRRRRGRLTRRTTPAADVSSRPRADGRLLRWRYGP